MEHKYFKQYTNFIKSQTEDNVSYPHFWKPIADKLNQLYKKKPDGGIHLYFSPDGVFNQINVNTLYNSSTRKYLLDEITVNLVTNTKDILTPVTVKEEVNNQLAYLFGFPNYNLYGETSTTPTPTPADNRTRSFKYDGGMLTELPGTKNEVENIAALMTSLGWQPEVLIGNEALEEKIKDSFKPRVLHVATHGYFQRSAELKENPFFRSGLMLAGANQAIAGKPQAAAEDGILTAYEAMTLNLDNTDLVVLSACETGLGDLSSGEGVYGLQRAFKVAGARTIIMSLWNVSDEATTLLMSVFYENWLIGKSKRQSFINAQLTLRTKFKNPFYWGAFVMVGE
jgi:CHAT domain-containing protein